MQSYRIGTCEVENLGNWRCQGYRLSIEESPRQQIEPAQDTGHVSCKKPSLYHAITCHTVLDMELQDLMLAPVGFSLALVLADKPMSPPHYCLVATGTFTLSLYLGSL